MEHRKIIIYRTLIKAKELLIVKKDKNDQLGIQILVVKMFGFYDWDTNQWILLAPFIQETNLAVICLFDTPRPKGLQDKALICKWIWSYWLARHIYCDVTSSEVKGPEQNGNPKKKDLPRSNDSILKTPHFRSDMVLRVTLARACIVDRMLFCKSVLFKRRFCLEGVWLNDLSFDGALFVYLSLTFCRL